MKQQTSFMCLALLMLSSLTWGQSGSNSSTVANGSEITQTEREYLAAKSYYTLLLRRTELLEQNLAEVAEDRASLGELKTSGRQIALLIDEIEQFTAELASLSARAKLASLDNKATDAEPASTPTERPRSLPTESGSSTSSAISQSSQRETKRGDLVKKPSTPTHDDVTGEAEDPEKQRLQALKASFRENYLSLHSENLLEHVDYYLAPHFETLMKNFIDGTVYWANRMRDREITPPIESIDDLDRECAAISVNSLKELQTALPSAKDIEGILLSTNITDYYPFRPVFDESNGEISYKRLADRDEIFSIDLFNSWLGNARLGSEEAFREDGNVWCSCTLAMMGGWSSVGIMADDLFDQIWAGSQDLCPTSWNQLHWDKPPVLKDI